MRLKMKRLRGFVCVSLILALLALPGMAFAEERGCTVTIPTYVEVTGTSSLTDAEFEVVLAGLDTEEPMPEKSSGTVKGSGQVVLGPMTYTVPEIIIIAFLKRWEMLRLYLRYSRLYGHRPRGERRGRRTECRSMGR